MKSLSHSSVQGLIARVACEASEFHQYFIVQYERIRGSISLGSYFNERREHFSLAV